MLDKDFFTKYQKQLVWLINTRLGRWFFRLENRKYTALFSSAVRWLREDGKSVTEISTRPRYALRVNKILKYLPFIWFEKYPQWYPRLNFGLTTSTFYPDANPETSSVDGQVFRNAVDESLATIRAGAGVGFDDNVDSLQAPMLQASTTSGQYQSLIRAVFLFDTSTLPDTDTISSATLSVYVTATTDTLSGSASANSVMVAVASTPASNTALAASDYGNVGSVDFGRSAQQDALSTNAYNAITLNASGIANISKTGVSGFALRYGWDFDNTTTGLTWASNASQRITINHAETADTTTDPKLVVVHAAPTAGKFFQLF